MRSIEQQLSRIDLNLLVSLSVLLKEKNVSRSAEKLFLSQPAMSRNLKKLRELFDDPLFYRESSGLRPTVKALEIETKLDRLLISINDFIAGEEFDPKTCNKTFNISAPSLMSHTLIFSIIKDLTELAPNIVIAQHSAISEPEKQLESGKLDFSIHINKAVGSDYSSTYVGDAKPVIYARKNHPLSKVRSITIEDCLTYKFVDLALDDKSNLQIKNPAKLYLEERDLEMSIAVKSGQLGLLTEVMKHSDHLLLSNHFLMSSSELKSNFVKVFSFDESKYAVKTFLVDHERTHSSQAHAWLKDVLINTLSCAIAKQ
jgi:DNA-binding transcriptional LysR family regulator